MVEKIDYLPSLGKSDHVVLSLNFNCFIEKMLSSQNSTTLTREIMSHV